jgi:hypothetical protein
LKELEKAAWALSHSRSSHSHCYCKPDDYRTLSKSYAVSQQRFDGFRSDLEI